MYFTNYSNFIISCFRTVSNMGEEEESEDCSLDEIETLVEVMDVPNFTDTGSVPVTMQSQMVPRSTPLAVERVHQKFGKVV